MATLELGKEVLVPTWREHIDLMKRVAQLESDVDKITAIASMFADLNEELFRRARANREAIDQVDAGVADVARKQEFTEIRMETIGSALERHGRLISKCEKRMFDDDLLDDIHNGAAAAFDALFGAPRRSW